VIDYIQNYHRNWQQ